MMLLYAMLMKLYVVVLMMMYVTLNIWYLIILAFHYHITTIVELPCVSGAGVYGGAVVCGGSGDAVMLMMLVDGAG